MKVENHLEFALFDYESVEASNVSLGDIIVKESEDGTSIGVVIQVHGEGEFRTDMDGNDSFCDKVRIATLCEIDEFRPELLQKLKD